MSNNKDITLYYSVDCFRSLKEKEQRFVLGIIAGMSNQQACSQAYPNLKPNSASSYAHKLLNRIDVRDAIAQLSLYKDNQFDVTANGMIKRAFALIGQMNRKETGLSDKNYETIVKLFDQINKLAGTYKQVDMPSQSTISIQINPIAPKKIDMTDAVLISGDTVSSSASTAQSVIKLKNLNKFLNG